MTLRWDERLYRLVIAIYPRSFRTDYGEAMAATLHEMLEDPSMSRSEVRLSMVRDFVRQARVPTAAGAACGTLVVVTWLAARTLHLGVSSGLVAVCLLLAIAGFAGARSAGGFIGGAWAGLVAGAISAVTVAGDFVLFGIFPFEGLRSFVATMATAATVAMGLAATGALIATLPVQGRRLTSGLGGFLEAWRAAG